jgi:hypothetical protein
MNSNKVEIGLLPECIAWNSRKSLQLSYSFAARLQMSQCRAGTIPYASTDTDRPEECLT